MKPPPFAVEARNCTEGESYGEFLTCLPCEKGFKLYKSQDKPGVCEPCQVEETCYGANTTAPVAEYWRTSPTSTNYLKCFNPSACLGGNSTEPIGFCAEGYGGVMCADCIGRFKRNGAFKCVECSEAQQNIMVSAMYFIGLIVAIIILVKFSMRGSNLRRPLSSVYLKIFLNHF